MNATGMENVRDVIPFPRVPGDAAYRIGFTPGVASPRYCVQSSRSPAMTAKATPPQAEPAEANRS